MAPAALIQIVADDAADRSALTRIVWRAGYRVRSARDAAEALDAIRHAQLTIDVAIVDAMLPAPRSIAVIDALRGRMSPLRIILISGHTRMMLRHFAELEPLMGVDALRFVSKPFDERELMATIEELLRCAEDRVHLVTGEWEIPTLTA